MDHYVDEETHLSLDCTKFPGRFPPVRFLSTASLARVIEKGCWEA